MKILLLVLGLILFGFITALQYKHLWNDVPELFKDLKKKKINEKTNYIIWIFTICLVIGIIKKNHTPQNNEKNSI
jgi:hypothetical protein